MKTAEDRAGDPTGTYTVRRGPDGYPELLPGRNVGPVSFSGRWMLQRVGIAIGDFAKELERTQFDGAVVDRTQLTGKFDIILKWGTTLRAQSPDETNTAEISEPPLLNALRDQLGLIVREGKSPAEVIVIDGMDSEFTPN